MHMCLLWSKRDFGGLLDLMKPKAYDSFEIGLKSQRLQTHL